MTDPNADYKKLSAANTALRNLRSAVAKQRIELKKLREELAVVGKERDEYRDDMLAEHQAAVDMFGKYDEAKDQLTEANRVIEVLRHKDAEHVKMILAAQSELEKVRDVVLEEAAKLCGGSSVSRVVAKRMRGSNSTFEVCRWRRTKESGVSEMKRHKCAVCSKRRICPKMAFGPYICWPCIREGVKRARKKAAP